MKGLRSESFILIKQSADLFVGSPLADAEAWAAGSALWPKDETLSVDQTLLAPLAKTANLSVQIGCFWLVCVLCLICCTVIARNSNKAALPRNDEAAIARERHAVFSWYLIMPIKVFMFFIQTCFLGVMFLSAFYNCCVLTISGRGRRGIKKSSLWIILGLTFSRRWGENMRPLRGPLREGCVEIHATTSIRRYKWRKGC